MVPVVILMVMPAQAIDISGSTQGLNMRVIVLFLADNRGNFCVVGIAVDVSGHLVFVIVVCMLVIVVIGMVIIIVVIAVIVVIMVVIGVIVIVVIGMVIIIMVGMLVIVVVGVIIVIMVVGVVIIIVIAMLIIVVIAVVIIIMVIGVIVIVVIAVIVMPAAGAKGDNPNTSRGVDQVAAFTGAFHRGQQGLFPARPIDEDHISFGHGCQVAGRGHKSMLISADRNQ